MWRLKKCTQKQNKNFVSTIKKIITVFLNLNLSESNCKATQTLRPVVGEGGNIIQYSHCLYSHRPGVAFVRYPKLRYDLLPVQPPPPLPPVSIFNMSGWHFSDPVTACLLNVPVRGAQRDVVYLGWPIAPSYMSSNAGGGMRGLSQWLQLCTAHGAQINF